MAYSKRNALWFGTLSGGMDWFPTPIQGAEMSPEGWSGGGTLLNGGGYQTNSFGSHKTYTFEWPQSSSREVAGLMKGYADGTYGRGLIYFIDPLIYDQNILPAQWADPSMVLGYEGVSHVYGETPTGSNTPNRTLNKLPFRSVTYDLGYVSSGFRGQDDAVFIPIPEGHTLLIGAVYTSSGTGGVFATPQSPSGLLQPNRKLSKVNPITPDGLVIDRFNDVEGIWLWIGKSSSGAAAVTVSAMIARLVKTSDLAISGVPTGNGYGLDPYGQTPYGSLSGFANVYGSGVYGQFTYGGDLPARVKKAIQGPWQPGLGHSGCRFIGKPTYVANNGVNGGQISFAASFREVGSWQ